jgi:glycerol-3-phosphate acyltransferase PlsX
MRLAVDVMGGDHAPDAILRGCVDALPDLGRRCSLCSSVHEDDHRDYLTERRVSDPRVVIEHASDVIEMDDSPAMAVRTKRDSSIVRDGAARVTQGRDPLRRRALGWEHRGVRRRGDHAHEAPAPRAPPGIAVTIPAFHGPLVLCDAGANPEPKAVHLWQYGVMCRGAGADTFSRSPSPAGGADEHRLGRGKGSGPDQGGPRPVPQDAGLNYIGYVEGRDLFDGA